MNTMILKINCSVPLLTESGLCIPPDFLISDEIVSDGKIACDVSSIDED